MAADAFGGHDDSGGGGIAKTAAKIVVLATILLGLFAAAGQIFTAGLHGLSNLSNLIPGHGGQVPGADLSQFAANPTTVAAQTNHAAGQLAAGNEQAALGGGRMPGEVSLIQPFGPTGP